MAQALRVGIYARLSLTTEESVSIDRQLQACRSYAEGQGYEVVLEATDDNVRATRVAPEKRAGFQKLLASADDLDVIIAWKVDRLARKTLDFLTLHEVLKEHDCTLAAVADHIDLTTPTGRAFATILAVFGEMEAAAISARAKSAREFLVKAGRQPGGRRPWPFASEPNPDGAGVVLRPIPDRAGGIRDAYRLIVEEHGTTTDVCRLFLERGLTPRLLEVSSMKGILRNPALCGARVHHGEPVREPDGTIRTDTEQAILTVDQWLALRAALDGRRRGPQPQYVELLSGGLLRCSGCNGTMSVSKHAYYQCGRLACPNHTTVRIDLADAAYVRRWLDTYGDARQGVARDRGPDPVELGRLREALDAIEGELDATRDVERIVELATRRNVLEEALTDLRRAGEDRPRLEPYDAPKGSTWREAWNAAEGLEQKRKILLDFGISAYVLPGKRGGGRPLGYDASERFDFSDWN